MSFLFNGAARFCVVSYALLTFNLHASSINNAQDIIDIASGSSAILSAQKSHENFDALVAKSKAWPDPKLNFSYSNMPIDQPWLGSSPMSGIQIGLSQTFPLPGQISSKVKAAKKLAQKQEVLALDEKNKIIHQALSLYYQLGAQRDLIRVTQKHIKSLEGLKAAVLEKYRVGMGEQYQLIQTKLMLKTLLEKFKDLKANERAILANLNGLLERNAHAEVGYSTAELTSSTLVDDSVDNYRQLAFIYNPKLRALKKQGEFENLKAKTLRAEQWPKPMLGVAYRFREAIPNKDMGTDFISLNLSLPLTFFNNHNKYGSQVSAAKHRESSAKFRHQFEASKLEGQLEGLVDNLRQSLSKEQAYKNSILPLARQSQASTLKAYQANKAQYADIYAAELKVIEAEQMAIQIELSIKLTRNNLLALAGSYITGQAS